MPTIRLLFIRTKTAESSGAKTPDPLQGSNSLVTFGSTPINRGPGSKSRGMFRNPTDTGLSFATVHAKQKGGDWERLQDGDSDKGNLLEENVSPNGNRGIRADYTYSVELTQSPRHGQRTFFENAKA